MRKLKKVLASINTGCIIISLLQGLFWIVLACCCVYGMQANKDFMVMFFLIYFGEITVVLLISITTNIVEKNIIVAKNILFEMDDDTYQYFREMVENALNKKKDRWVVSPLFLVFKRVKTSLYLFDRAIISKCNKNKINIKDLEKE